MTSRYGYAEDGNTAWCVVDYERGGATVSRHHIEQGARAEAARLNAAAGKRAAPVTAWAVIRKDVISNVYFYRATANIYAREGDRIARVRIEEIEE